MATVVKADLARILVEEMGCSQAKAKKAVDTLVEGLADALIQGRRIEIRGFGSWDVKATNARDHARNPRTGEDVFVPARRKAVFKPGKMIKDALSQPLDVLQAGNGA